MLQDILLMILKIFKTFTSGVFDFSMAKKLKTLLSSSSRTWYLQASQNISLPRQFWNVIQEPIKWVATKFAQAYKIAQGEKFAKRAKLHEDTFALEDKEAVAH